MWWVQMAEKPKFCYECGARLSPNNRGRHWGSCSNATPVDSPVSQQAKESPTTRMTMQGSVKSVFTKYLIFEGRASRPEYWWFQLAYWMAIIISMLIPVFGFVLMTLVVLGCTLPNLAVGSRRLHDSNKSGWYQLIGLVPVVGTIGLIVLLALPSDTGENQYGSP